MHSRSERQPGRPHEGRRRTIRQITTLSLSLTSLAAVAQARPPDEGGSLKVGIILSATGPAASIGQTQKNAVALLPKTLGGMPVAWLVLDDGSDTTGSVKNARKLLSEEHVDVLVGPSLTPSSLAVIDLMGESKTPMISLAGSAAIVEPVAQRHWVFKTPQSDQQMTTAIVGHMVANGVKTVGFIGFNDAYGEGWGREFGKLAELRKLQIVANERYVRTDTSVTGQVLKLMAARPDAIFIAASGTPAALPQLALAERGFRGRIYQTHGVANGDFLRVGGKALEGTFLPASPMLVAEQLPATHPSRAVALDFVKRYEALYGAGSRSAFAGYLIDASLILDRAVTQARSAAAPGSEAFRSGLRDAIERTRDVVGPSGVFNLSAQDHLGLDQRSRVMVQIRDGKWLLAESL